MSDSALARTSRALDLIPFIVENPGISIKELAQEFHTSPAEITKDLNLLFVCGLPGYSPLELIDLAFDDDYVSVIDPQVLDRPRKLTRREAISLILSLDGLAGVRASDDPLRIEIENIRKKLSQAIEGADALAANFDSKSAPFLQVCESAISEKHYLSIQYASGRKDEITLRTIAPQRLYLERGQVYLRAYCYLANEDRTFRLDRILRADVLTENPQNAVKPTGAVESLRNLQSQEAPVLEISPAGRNFLEENSHVIMEVFQLTEKQVATMHPVDPEWLIRSVLAQGPGVRMLRPKSLKEELETRVSQTLALYQQN